MNASASISLHFQRLGMNAADAASRAELFAKLDAAAPREVTLWLPALEGTLPPITPSITDKPPGPAAAGAK